MSFHFIKQFIRKGLEQSAGQKEKVFLRNEKERGEKHLNEVNPNLTNWLSMTKKAISKGRITIGLNMNGGRNKCMR